MKYEPWMRYATYDANLSHWGWVHFPQRKYGVRGHWANNFRQNEAHCGQELIGHKEYPAYLINWFEAVYEI